MNDNYRRQQQQLYSMAANNNVVLQRTSVAAVERDNNNRQLRNSQHTRQQIQLEEELAGCHLSGLPSPLQLQQQHHHQQLSSQRDNLPSFQFNQNKSRPPKQPQQQQPQQSMSSEFEGQANEKLQIYRQHLKQSAPDGSRQLQPPMSRQQEQHEHRNGRAQLLTSSSSSNGGDTPTRPHTNSSESHSTSSFRSMFSNLLAGGKHSQSKSKETSQLKANGKHQKGQHWQDDQLVLNPSTPSKFHNSDQFNCDQYASQLRSQLVSNRNSQPQQQQQQQFNYNQTANERPPITQMSQQQQEAPSTSLAKQQICDTKQPNEQQPAKQALHVNFNRPGRQAAGANGAHHNNNNGAADDDENGDSCRKKKYLTAKYGQQQMNLIKKRLKIEMWLCERLKELAKGSKSEAELADIDIDLDQLLDLENDAMRQNWLKKTMEPFDDLPSDKINKFICDVLEQSKLL